jgi:hypothetical protein
MAQATAKAFVAVKPKEVASRFAEWLAVTATIALREVKSLFSSWVAYVTLAFFELWTGFFFLAYIVNLQTADLRYLFWNMAVILFIVLPMVTMRLLAEERRLGTMELLLTSPVTDWQVVLGKFFGAYLWLVIALGLTLYVPYLVYRFSGGTVDLGPYWTAYLGLLLLAPPPSLSVSFGRHSPTIRSSPLSPPSGLCCWRMSSLGRPKGRGRWRKSVAKFPFTTAIKISRQGSSKAKMPSFSWC